MGRGRAKAKQTRVARKLKYYSPDTDLNALQRELRSENDDGPDTDDAAERPGDEDDEYGSWATGQR